ncbi:MAG TPA: glycosyltransferase, partial [Cyclobacteriaceae bacterium]|nr:glycosyltransferase [Cyclobacteriaceae bacterium]
MSNRRILVIENSTVVTGAMKAIVNSTSQLQSSFSFQYIIPKGSTTRSAYPPDSVHELRMVELSKRVGSLISYIPRLIANAFFLKKFVKQHSVDLVHVNDLYNLIPVAAKIFGCRVPYVCHVRFMPERFPPALFNFWLNLQLKHSSKVMVVSEALKKKLPHHEKIVVVYDGYAFDKSREMASDGSTFLYLSNFIAGKGQDHALKAFINVHKQLPGWKLRFVGGD